jgi:hypothetical protein
VTQIGSKREKKSRRVKGVWVSYSLRFTCSVKGRTYFKLGKPFQKDRNGWKRESEMYPQGCVQNFRRGEKGVE